MSYASRSLSGAAVEPLGERLALVDGHRQPHVLRLDAVVLELHDVGVADGGEHDQLALDVAADVERARQDLQRDAVLGHVDALGDVDLAEHALAERLDRAGSARPTTSPWVGSLVSSTDSDGA